MIALIAARAKNGVIGSGGRIPWAIPGEQKRFKELTMGHALIMGRRTYEEIGRPLPGRLNIVLSRTADFEAPGCLIARSLQQAIGLADGKDIFVAGGAGVYAEALPLAEKLYLTEVELEPEGDTFFPIFDEAGFIRTAEPTVCGEIPYTYVVYTRKQAEEAGL